MPALVGVPRFVSPLCVAERSAAGPLRLIVVDPHGRLITALGEEISERLYADGVLYLSTDRIDQIAAAQQVPDADTRAALDLLHDHFLLRRHGGGWDYGEGIGLMLLYEQQIDRRLFWERNVLRREILRVAAEAYDRDGAERGSERPYAA